MYSRKVLVLSSSVDEITVTSIICEGSLFSFPPARFQVRCVADPFKPSHLAAFLESRLVLDLESNIARTKFPFLFTTSTFCTWHKPLTGFNLLFWDTAFPWMLPFDVVERVFGIDFGTVLPLDSNLCLFRQFFHYVDPGGGFFCICCR